MSCHEAIAQQLRCKRCCFSPHAADRPTTSIEAAQPENPTANQHAVNNAQYAIAAGRDVVTNRAAIAAASPVVAAALAQVESGSDTKVGDTWPAIS